MSLSFFLLQFPKIHVLYLYIHMKSVNLVILIGHLTHDPETKTVTSQTSVTTTIANFSIAINTKWKTKDGEEKEEVDYYRIVAFNKLAETVEKYLKKGRKVYVRGHLSTSKYTTKEGQTRTSTEIIADDINMLDSLKETEAEETAAVENIPPTDPSTEAEAKKHPPFKMP